MSPTSDLRLAARDFLRQPGLTTAAVVALGLGIGLTTLLFCIGYGIFLRDLPVPHGSRIAAISMSNVSTGRQRLEVTIHDLSDWRAAQTTFDDLAAFQMASMNVVVREGQPERLAGAWMTPSGFSVLGAQPLLGRVFTDADGSPAAPSVIVLGHGPWMTRFGGDPGVVGRVVRANGQPTLIIGVMPPGFGFPSLQEAWMPLRVNPLETPRGTGPSLTAFGRLKPGVGIAAAQADLGTIAGRLAAEHPDTNRNRVPVVQPYTQMMGGGPDSRVAMVLTMALGFGVLLIACANVANLLFARAATRARDIAIRSALGASRRRLMVQMLLESCALAAGGTIVGLGVAMVGVSLFNESIVDKSPPFWIVVRLDTMPLLFAVALTGLSALLSGTIPAWRASRADLNEVMKDGTRGTGGLRIGRLSRTLVTAEIVLSFGLLVAAGLMVRSITNLGTHQYNFAMDDVFTARLILPAQAYPDASSRDRVVGSLQDRLARLPGVSEATLATSLPGLSSNRTTAIIEGVAYPDPSHHPIVRTAAIGDHYFETFGARVSSGRSFRASDDTTATGVAIVNASFARLFLGDADPIGRRLRLGRDPSAPWLTVVGVAPDLYMAGAEDQDPAGIYVPLRQSRDNYLALALRGRDAAKLTSAVRSTVAALDPDLPIYFPMTLRQAVDDSVWAYRVFGPLLVVVGAAALFLASVGLYSLMAFATRQRLREIGLRIALGARPVDVARLVVGEVVSQLGAGLALGAAFGAAISSATRAMVFHVSPHDPLIYGTIVLTLVAAAATAALVPVRRAIHVDPTVTLRES